ncbi:type IV inositol polyphosphate 5-phosphatase 9 [Cannabis sativa]|uniref:type IV inositol polyphosphate 5-phosphatase 9 n=1 Tax=Cannabis sativa TaxID=3483 RepID=UPI0029CA0FC9|nr:type IV inositol polyphosphate 5-phosphatase 9 [Cannabis sativa]
MWPRLVANKVLKKRLGSNNFVADFPINNNESTTSYLPEENNNRTTPCPTFYDHDDHDDHHHTSLTLNTTIFNQHKLNVHKYKFFTSTWNVGGVEPHEDLNLEDWIDPSCDIYVFGFQEIVPLKASNVLGYSESSRIARKWNNLIRQALNKKINNNKFYYNNNKGIKESSSFEEIKSFQCIISKEMVGILVSVWVRTTLRPFIKHQSVSCVGCGIMGCLGNKGAVSVRFQIHETSLCIVCSHLASGGRQGDEKYRNSNVSEVLSRTTFPRGPLLDLPQKILDHDRVIWLGDLNYRISLPEAKTRLLVDKGNWSALLENDQLRRELMDGQVFEGWQEGAIRFAPTYKYCLNSDLYFGVVNGTKGEKKRAPAWCDRIIWYGEGLKQDIYSRGESKLSDHKPVKAIFSAEVCVLKNLGTFHGFFLSERFEQINTNNIDIDHISSHDDHFICNNIDKSSLF